MNEIRTQLEEMVREQRKTNRKLDLWTYRIMFFWSMLTGMLSRDKIGKTLGYVGAALAGILQILTYVEDIMDIIKGPGEDEDLIKSED